MVGGEPVAVEAEGDPVRQVDRGDRLQSGGVEDDQIATVGGGVIDEPHQHSFVLGGLRRDGDEDELADALVRTESPGSGQAAA